MHGAFRLGRVRVSTSHASAGDSAYIGDWENNWGYVLGYFVPGSKMYAQHVTSGSVYGLIVGGYGAWDNGHHCGWIGIGKGVNVRGSGSHSNVGNTCPTWNNDFSLSSGEGPGTGAHHDPTMFRKNTWVNCNGCVQGAKVVFFTCSDFTVYANYEPLTHTFNDPDGTEVANRGSVWSSTDSYVSKTGVKATTGYSGFGTRFVSADNYAVEIKDTQRPGSHVTAFGCMHADCIAGSQVGQVAGVWPPSKPSCGTLEPGQSLSADGEVMACGHQYWLTLDSSGKLEETQYQVGQLLGRGRGEGRPPRHADRRQIPRPLQRNQGHLGHDDEQLSGLVPGRAGTTGTSSSITAAPRSGRGSSLEVAPSKPRRCRQDPGVTAREVRRSRTTPRVARRGGGDAFV